MLILPYLHKVGQYSKCPHDLGRSSQKPSETVGGASGHPQFCLILGGEHSNQLKLSVFCVKRELWGSVSWLIDKEREKQLERKKQVKIQWARGKKRKDVWTKWGKTYKIQMATSREVEIGLESEALSGSGVGSSETCYGREWGPGPLYQNVWGINQSTTSDGSLHSCSLCCNDGLGTMALVTSSPWAGHYVST